MDETFKYYKTRRKEVNFYREPLANVYVPGGWWCVCRWIYFHNIAVQGKFSQHSLLLTKPPWKSTFYYCLLLRQTPWWRNPSSSGSLCAKTSPIQEPYSSHIRVRSGDVGNGGKWGHSSPTLEVEKNERRYFHTGLDWLPPPSLSSLAFCFAPCLK